MLQVSDVLDRASADEQVVDVRQHVVRFVEGAVSLQQRQRAVDRLGDPQLRRQTGRQSQATVSRCLAGLDLREELGVPELAAPGLRVRQLRAIDRRADVDVTRADRTGRFIHLRRLCSESWKCGYSLNRRSWAPLSVSFAYSRARSACAPWGAG